MIKYTRPFLGQVSKAKAAKLVRTLVDMFLDMEASTGKEVSLVIKYSYWHTIFNYCPVSNSSLLLQETKIKYPDNY